jgi:hypothetical protein
MSATLTNLTTPAAPRQNPRGGRRTPSSRRDPALDAWYRRLHAQLIGEKRPLSGRAGHYVYYWAYGHLCWRVHVVPKDPRTAVQQRSRAAFAAASKAWSASQPLTQEQRKAWRADAARIRSTPRLGQSGPLTAQQDFVGCNALKERWGLALLLEPSGRGSQKAEGLTQNARPATQVHQQHEGAQSSSGTRRACAGPPPSLPGAAGASPRKTIGRFARSQVLFPQHLTRPHSDRLHSASIAPPGQCRWKARSPRRVGSMGLPLRFSSLIHIRRTARVRELWRGG